jgi:hypothetical protein
MQTYHIEIKGIQPLLMHNDDIGWADTMDAWKSDKDNKKSSKAGDDRSPAFRWIGSLYRNEKGIIVMPTENVMRALMEGGAMVPVPGAKNAKTFKSQSQSGVMPTETGWPLLIKGKAPDGKVIDKLLGEKDFETHKEEVKKIGFELFLKRARIGSSKHIRVRPKFHDWAIAGQLRVNDEQITQSVLEDILDMAGKYKGLGDWRPSSKTPGVYGMFEAKVKKV